MMSGRCSAYCRWRTPATPGREQGWAPDSLAWPGHAELPSSPTVPLPTVGSGRPGAQDPAAQSQHASRPRPSGTGGSRPREHQTRTGRRRSLNTSPWPTLLWKQGPRPRPAASPVCPPRQGHQDADRVCLLRSGEGVGAEVQPIPQVPRGGPAGSAPHRRASSRCSRHHRGRQGRSCPHHICLERQHRAEVATFPNAGSWAGKWE